MKIKFSVAYLLTFLSLVFVIHEFEDWMHVMIGEWICGCWGTKGFNSWTLCDHSDVSGNILVFVWLAGPLLAYSVIWVAWSVLESKRSTSTWSIGFSLLFATLPLGRILTALSGTSDETYAFRELFQRPDGSNHGIVVALALMLVLALTIPPIIKSAKIAGGLKENLYLIPLFLVLPLLADYLVVSLGMNKLLSTGVMQEESLPGTPFFVLLWGVFCLIYLLSTYRNLLTLFKKSEHRRRKRKSPVPIIEE